MIGVVGGRRARKRWFGVGRRRADAQQRCGVDVAASGVAELPRAALAQRRFGLHLIALQRGVRSLSCGEPPHDRGLRRTPLATAGARSVVCCGGEVGAG